MGISIEDLGNEENAEVIKNFIAESGYVAKTELEGLKKNKDIILKEKKQQQTLADELKSKNEELEAKLFDLEEQVNVTLDEGVVEDGAKLLDDKSKAFERKLEIERRKADKEIQKITDNNSLLQKDLDTFRKNHYNDLVRRKIEGELDKIDVSSIYKNFLVNDFISRAKYEVSEDGYNVSSISIEDSDGVSIDMADSMKSFSQSENFRHFQKQPDSSGGGANPSLSNANGNKHGAGKKGSLIPEGTFKTY